MLLKQHWKCDLSVRVCVSYGLVCAVDAGEEECFSDEERDAQVLVDGVSVALQATEEAEGEDADEQTDQRQQDPHPRDDVQQQIMNRVCRLQRERDTDQNAFTSLWTEILQLDIKTSLQAVTDKQPHHQSTREHQSNDFRRLQQGK